MAKEIQILGKETMQLGMGEDRLLDPFSSLADVITRLQALGITPDILERLATAHQTDPDRPRVVEEIPGQERRYTNIL